MRNELEKRIRKQRAELDGIAKDKTELDVRERTGLAVLAELEALLRLAPKNDGVPIVERQLRVDTDPYQAREALRKARRPMHIKELLEDIGGDTGRNRRSSLAAQLGAYARKHEIFTKNGPNVFGLLDYGPEPITLTDQRQFNATGADDGLTEEEENEIPVVTGNTWGDDEIPF